MLPQAIPSARRKNEKKVRLMSTQRTFRVRELNPGHLRDKILTTILTRTNADECIRIHQQLPIAEWLGRQLWVQKVAGSNPGDAGQKAAGGHAHRKKPSSPQTPLHPKVRQTFWRTCRSLAPFAPRPTTSLAAPTP